MVSGGFAEQGDLIWGETNLVTELQEENPGSGDKCSWKHQPQLGKAGQEGLMCHTEECIEFFLKAPGSYQRIISRKVITDFRRNISVALWLQNTAVNAHDVLFYLFLKKYLLNEQAWSRPSIKDQRRADTIWGVGGAGSFELCDHLLDLLLSINGDQFPELCPEMRFPPPCGGDFVET